jgi:hypothetical protein
MHGVRENPLIIRALMRHLGLTSLALEWSDGLTPVIRDYLAERQAAGPLDLALIDGITGADRSWTQRDEAMAARRPARAATARRPGHPDQLCERELLQPGVTPV